MKIEKIFFTVFFVFLKILTNAQIKTEIILPDSNLVFKTGNIEGVILGKKFKFRSQLDSNYEKNPLHVIANDFNAKSYMLSPSTAIRIESELKQFIKERDSFIANNLNSYIKQYYGYMTSNKDTIVYINCFYDSKIENEGYWKRKIVFVYDGWHYFFNIKYNLTRKIFFDLWINPG
ncbi:MAG: hypothetical protein Q8M15_04320 [Bacteroidota bacterium]|nr:hypothetical protein [Bacteroidota bacterium]